VLKKASRNRDAADIAVDDPSKAMLQFTEGLRHVLAAPKIAIRTKPRRKRKGRHP